MYKGHQLKSKLQNTGTRSTAASAPPPVLSPSNILPPHSSHCAFIPTRKKFGARCKNFSLLLLHVQLFKSESRRACVKERAVVTMASFKVQYYPHISWGKRKKKWKSNTAGELQTKIWIPVTPKRIRNATNSTTAYGSPTYTAYCL